MRRFLFEASANGIYVYMVEGEKRKISFEPLLYSGELYYKGDAVADYWQWFSDEISLLAEEKADCLLLCAAVELELVEKLRATSKGIILPVEKGNWTDEELQIYFADYRENGKIRGKLIVNETGTGFMLSGKDYYVKGLKDIALTVDEKVSDIVIPQPDLNESITPIEEKSYAEAGIKENEVFKYEVVESSNRKLISNAIPDEQSFVAESNKKEFEENITGAEFYRVLKRKHEAKDIIKRVR